MISSHTKLTSPLLENSLETVGCSEDVSVGDESSTTSVDLVGLGGSQEHQSSPGELSHLRLLAANDSELIICISFFLLFGIFEILRRLLKISTTVFIRIEWQIFKYLNYLYQR